MDQGDVPRGVGASHLWRGEAGRCAPDGTGGEAGGGHRAGAEWVVTQADGRAEGSQSDLAVLAERAGQL